MFIFQISAFVSIMLSLVPFGMLILFNLLIYCLIKSRGIILPRSNNREKRDLRVAMIMILIIIVYIACHGIITYINIIELRAIITGKIIYFRLFYSSFTMTGSAVTQLWGHNMNIMVSISHLLITISCSSNFAIYCGMVSIFTIYLLSL